MGDSIRQAAKTNVKVPRVDFTQGNFDKLIDDKGYKVIKYDAIACPCKSQGLDHLTTCENCLGLGWVFINPIRIKAIITSINKDTVYKYWSPEFLGTIALTVKDEDSQRLSFMDKIIVEDQTSILSEVRPVKTTGAQKFIFTSYPVKSINSIFLFQGVGSKLLRLTEAQYEISEDNPYVVKFNAGVDYPDDFNNVVTIDYKHLIQYNVQDIPHDVRVSQTLDSKGKPTTQGLPIQAICRKSHYLTGDSPKYGGTGLQDNSYL